MLRKIAVCSHLSKGISFALRREKNSGEITLVMELNMFVKNMVFV